MTFRVRDGWMRSEPCLARSVRLQRCLLPELGVCGRRCGGPSRRRLRERSCTRWSGATARGCGTACRRRRRRRRDAQIACRHTVSRQSRRPQRTGASHSRPGIQPPRDDVVLALSCGAVSVASASAARRVPLHTRRNEQSQHHGERAAVQEPQRRNKQPPAPVKVPRLRLAAWPRSAAACYRRQGGHWSLRHEVVRGRHGGGKDNAM